MFDLSAWSIVPFIIAYSPQVTVRLTIFLLYGVKQARKEETKSSAKWKKKKMWSAPAIHKFGSHFGAAPILRIYEYATCIQLFSYNVIKRLGWTDRNAICPNHIVGYFAY